MVLLSLLTKTYYFLVLLVLYQSLGCIYICYIFYKQFCKSALTVITGFIVSTTLFDIFFHSDNKKKYIKKLTGKLNFNILKQTLIKMVALANSAFDIINDFYPGSLFC